MRGHLSDREGSSHVPSSQATQTGRARSRSEPRIVHLYLCLSPSPHPLPARRSLPPFQPLLRRLVSVAEALTEAVGMERQVFLLYFPDRKSTRLNSSHSSISYS